MIIRYKKGFTLIELMVVTVLGLILLNFVFSFQFNFIKNLQYLKDKEKLAMNSYKLGYMISRGIYIENNLTFFDGLISLKTYTGESFFESYNGNTNQYRVGKDKHLSFTVAGKTYIYNSLFIDNEKILFKISTIFEIKMNLSVNEDLNLIGKFNNKLGYKDYSKLVYSR